MAHRILLTALAGVALSIPMLVSAEELKGNPNQGMLFAATSCYQCHGLTGSDPEFDRYPRLIGQHEDYLFKQLVAFREGDREHTEMSPIMQRPQFQRDQALRDVAAWYASHGCE